MQKPRMFRTIPPRRTIGAELILLLLLGNRGNFLSLRPKSPWVSGMGKTSTTSRSSWVSIFRLGSFLRLRLAARWNAPSTSSLVALSRSGYPPMEPLLGARPLASPTWTMTPVRESPASAPHALTIFVANSPSCCTGKHNSPETCLPLGFNFTTTSVRQPKLS